MTNQLLRTRPFRGFSRGIPANGIPIVGRGGPVELPEGLHFYQIPALVQRPGEQLEAKTFEANFKIPMDGRHYKRVQEEIVAKLKAAEPDRPEPSVVLLSPFYLGFVPQAALDKQAEDEEQAKAAAAAPPAPEGESPC